MEGVGQLWWCTECNHISGWSETCQIGVHLILRLKYALGRELSKVKQETRDLNELPASEEYDDDDMITAMDLLTSGNLKCNLSLDTGGENYYTAEWDASSEQMNTATRLMIAYLAARGVLTRFGRVVSTAVDDDSQSSQGSQHMEVDENLLELKEEIDRESDETPMVVINDWLFERPKSSSTTLHPAATLDSDPEDSAAPSESERLAHQPSSQPEDSAAPSQSERLAHQPSSQPEDSAAPSQSERLAHQPCSQPEDSAAPSQSERLAHQPSSQPEDSAAPSQSERLAHQPSSQPEDSAAPSQSERLAQQPTVQPDLPTPCNDGDVAASRKMCLGVEELRSYSAQRQPLPDSLEHLEVRVMTDETDEETLSALADVLKRSRCPDLRCVLLDRQENWCKATDCKGQVSSIKSILKRDDVDVMCVQCVKFPTRNAMMSHISFSKPGERTTEKENVIKWIQYVEVPRLLGLRCNYDPEWSLRLLQVAKKQPDLECLEVMWLGQRHLDVVNQMRHLKRLEIFADDTLYRNPPHVQFPPDAEPYKLTFLEVEGLHHLTLLALLCAHRTTLQQIEVLVDPPGRTSMPENKPIGRGDGGRPLDSEKFKDVLRQCKFQNLKVVIVNRIYPTSHRPYVGKCREQIAELKTLLPGVLVMCDRCDENMLKKKTRKRKRKPTNKKKKNQEQGENLKKRKATSTLAASTSAEPSLAASTSAAPSLAASTSAEPSLAASTSAAPSLAASTSAAPSLAASTSAAPS